MSNLKSITKSTYINEGLKVLEQIEKENYDDYKELMDKVSINQNSEESRKTCWGQIKKRYLDLDDDKNLLYSPMIKLFNNNIILKKELMYLNYIYTEPTFKKIIVELIYPRLKESNGKLIIKREEITDFLSQYLNFTQATLKKTTRSSAKALIDFGIADVDGKKIIISYYQPELKTVIYALYNEYSNKNSKYNNYNILNPSLEHIKRNAEFIEFLLINPNFIESFLQSAWNEGYLSYEARGGLNQYVLKHKNVDDFANYVNEKEA